MRERYPVIGGSSTIRRNESDGSGSDERIPVEDVETPKKAEKLLLAEARRSFTNFQERLGKTIAAYYGTPDITFTVEPGGFYIDLEALRVNVDPNFFLERGYSESEALFATFHEAEHFRDMLLDSEAYTALFDHINRRESVHRGYPRALHRLYNCIDDVLVNRAVMRRWRAGSQAKDRLYPKLFPKQDLRITEESDVHQPRHRQFMYALLRQAMLPDEEVVVDEDVQRMIDELQARGGRRTFIDVLTSVDQSGSAIMNPQERFRKMRVLIEPLFEELYLRDLEDRQQQDKKSERKEKSDDESTETDSSSESVDADPFGEDPFDDAIPDPISPEDLKDAIDKLKAKQKKKNKEEKQKHFEQAMGVTEADFRRYQLDYDRIAPHIEDLSKVFDEVINRRKQYRRVLRHSVKEGQVYDPNKFAIGIAQIKSGILDPQIMLDLENIESMRNLPNEFEITLVGDGSGSMSGAKRIMQQRLAVLVVEAFRTFMDRIKEERDMGENIELDVKTEVRLFSDSDEELKPLSQSLTHVERVSMHRRLRKLPGGGNNEAATFAAIQAEQFSEERITKLHDGRLKKIIIFLTDGGTDKEMVQGCIRSLYDEIGLSPEEKSNLVIAAIGFGDGRQVEEVYAPNGHFAEKTEDVIGIFTKIISEIVSKEL